MKNLSGDLQSSPRLRWPLDVQRVESNNEQFIVLRDQLGIATEPAVIPAAIMPILARLDGQHSLQEILTESSPYGVTAEFLHRIVFELDALNLIDTSRTRARLGELREDYRMLAEREAALAGVVYSADPQQLNRELIDYLSRASRGEKFSLKAQQKTISMICPHIDYRRGWETYAAAYRILEVTEPPDIIILLGTAHQPAEGIFHLTDKDFKTPLGTAPVAKSLIRDLANFYGSEKSFKEELLHKREHSLELQLPFLMHRYGGENPPEILPILVGSFHPFVAGHLQPIDNSEVRDFVDGLSGITKNLLSSGKKVLFYGGVDLAHIGLSFGDHERISETGLEQLELRDRELLECVLEGDEHRLFEHIASDQDKRRICGFPSIYTMLASMKRAGISTTGHLIDYQQAVDSKTDCVVSFAAAAWTR